ncbi:T7SS effector LXG polymorphic toxin [Psychrobacillus sp. NPDC093180]|uniref:T7SS effector LXG polymorphic toxin n=1 Tax=Psychrobacillus sp. NPDC093180 TaxID=3364489 RepID=UPI0037F17C46
METSKNDFNLAVSEASFMKVLDVDLFQDGLHRNITMLDRLGKEIETIQKSVDGLVAMEEALKGEGGNAIRAFYAECHIPFLQFFQVFQNRFTAVLKQIEAALNALEPDPAGYILEQFLVGEVEEGLQQIAELTETLTNETNSIMDQVADIVGLPYLDDSGVQLGVRDAKIKRDDTVTRLHEFDATQTKALWTIEDDLNTMESWITDIEGLFKEGLTDIHFQADRWGIISSENKLKVDLSLQKATLGALSGKKGLDIQPETMLRTFLASMNPIMFGLNGLIHKPNAFWSPSILAFASMPDKPVSDNQLNKPTMTEEEQLEALYAELAKHPNLANPSNDAPIDTATGDYMFTYEGMRKVLGGNGTGTPDGLAPYAVATFDFYTEDLATMFGPDATGNERLQAAAFTFIKPAKVADIGHDLLKGTKSAGNVKYGEQYTKVNRKKTLKPNIEYTTNEGYKYTTDEDGRIAIAEANLELGKAKRNPYAQRTVGGDDRLSNDDGGHLIASIFKGSGEIDNLVPMNATLNRSEYKTLENTWKKALEEGKEVTIKIKPIYEAQSARPSEFKINYTIDGKKYSDRLTNYPGGK